MSESTLYYFYSVGCGWCKKTEPLVDELNESGYDILKLDLTDKDNQELNTQLKEKYGATLITTEKDYMRIDINYRQKLNFVPIKIEFENKNFFENILKNKI